MTLFVNSQELTLTPTLSSCHLISFFVGLRSGEEQPKNGDAGISRGLPPTAGFPNLREVCLHLYLPLHGRLCEYWGGEGHGHRNSSLDCEIDAVFEVDNGGGKEENTMEK